MKIQVLLPDRSARGYHGIHGRMWKNHWCFISCFPNGPITADLEWTNYLECSILWEPLRFYVKQNGKYWNKRYNSVSKRVENVFSVMLTTLQQDTSAISVFVYSWKLSIKYQQMAPLHRINLRKFLKWKYSWNSEIVCSFSQCTLTLYKV